MSDSDLYGDDILLWAEMQSALLRKLAAGETVSKGVDWPHIVEEIEEVGRADVRRQEQEIARLTALLAAAAARIDDLTRELADTQAELAAIREQAEAAAAHAAAAAETEPAIL
jgi:hypothetical protein